MWLSGYGCQNAFFVFFACFRPYIGQPDNHIGWATLMSFTSIIPTDYRTNPTQYHEKNLRIDGFAKRSFFESAILEFFLLNPIKSSQRFLGSKDGSKILCLCTLFSSPRGLGPTLMHRTVMQSRTRGCAKYNRIRTKCVRTNLSQCTVFQLRGQNYFRTFPEHMTT